MYAKNNFRKRRFLLTLQPDTITTIIHNLNQTDSVEKNSTKEA